MQPPRSVSSIGPVARARRAHLREISRVFPVAAAAGPCCACGHGHQAHEHYRRGNDCALCACVQFSSPVLAGAGLVSR